MSKTKTLAGGLFATGWIVSAFTEVFGIPFTLVAGGLKLAEIGSPVDWSWLQIVAPVLIGVAIVIVFAFLSVLALVADVVRD